MTDAGVRSRGRGVVTACLLAGGLGLLGCGGLGIDAPPHQIVPPDGNIAVRTGDTVYDISRRYGVPVRAIIDDNRLQPPFKLKLDAQLNLPQPRHHVVARGDTVYAIARRNGVDRSALVRINGIAPPYTIKVGQRLRLPAPTEVAAAGPAVVDPPPAAVTAETVAAPPPPSRSRSAAAAAAKPPPPQSMPPPSRSPGRFLWPLRGRLISKFGAKEDGLRNDGINIAAPRGSFVRAAENGVVAYAGNELGGFGNLLLIKHAGGWTTAYAHNEELLVRRGDRVSRGQAIARVGSTGNIREPQLHFEIRRGKSPVDPRKHLEMASRAGSNVTGLFEDVPALPIRAAGRGGRRGPG